MVFVLLSLCSMREGRVSVLCVLRHEMQRGRFGALQSIESASDASCLDSTDLPFIEHRRILDRRLE